MKITALPYPSNSADLFARIADLPWAAYLDSCQPHSQQGRYDIMTALPYKTISDIPSLKKEITRHSSQSDDGPFTGGALGYFSYDSEICVGLYDWAIIVDHHKKIAYMASEHRDPNTKNIWPELLDRLQKPAPQPSPFKLTSPFQSSLTRMQYQHAFERIQEYIRAGDCYQVNLSQQFTADFAGSPWEAYQRLRLSSPVPYGAYLNFPQMTVLSLSPERFLQVKNNQVATKPIKGTRPRNTDPIKDQQLAQELLNSPKDRAENLMIVDLLRNDLGKSCKIGSIKVPSLFALESFPAVHHLVSTITGELAADKSSVDLLEGCFPGGSITGAPKRRAMEIIAELEPHKRGLYCGAIGYIGFNGDMDTNIAIRTLTCQDGKVSCSAGGALVADSDCEDEYQETLIKINRLLRI